MSDIISQIIEQFQEKIPSSSEQLAFDIEKQMRQHYGGGHVYVGKTSEALRRYQAKKSGVYG